LTKDWIQIEPHVKIIDDRFESEQLDLYRLFLLVGSLRIQFCVIDSETNRCLALEAYQLESSSTSSVLVDRISQIIENHSFLPAKFWKSVHVCVANDKFTLVPLSLFKPENALNYLQLNCEVDKSIHFITHFAHKQAGIANVFALDLSLHNWLSSYYSEVKTQFIHQTSPLIEAILRQESIDNKPSLIVFVGYEYMGILVKDKSALKFCNKFFFKTDEDFLYYLMLVINELGLEKQTNIELYGEILAKSNIFRLLKNFFSHVHFGNRPSPLKFGYVFDEISEHTYFDLLSICYCVV